MTSFLKLLWPGLRATLIRHGLAEQLLRHGLLGLVETRRRLALNYLPDGAGLETAMQRFHIDRYLADWRQLIQDVLGRDTI